MLSKHVLLNALLPLVFLFTLKLALAALPSSLNYQGHLTDTAGVPIDGPVNMVFAIYDIDTGGTALWSDTRSVTIDQGVFSVELGGGSNPFPLGLFENPLWMGLTVGSDAEMAPRRPISSAAFSFKADDANTLEGVSAGTLDQSAHAIDTANPHSVTTTQIGAADAADLSAHTGDTSNPHSVSPAQIGATRQTEFDLHKTNNSAHHTRYTNTEAVTAMGLQHDSNSLNHAKYTDSNTVTAMLANDGAGSTLDSDKVDGLEASELIDAAQDEVRTPISTLPYTINASGSYYLTGNLDGSTGGIDITADNVTLDLMGFTIDGGLVDDIGIDFTNQSAITIRNGTIKSFGRAGIYQSNTASRSATISDVYVLGNGTDSSEHYSGMYIRGLYNHIENCTVGDNGGYAIYAGAGSIVENNIAYGSGGDYGIRSDSGNIITGNTVFDMGGTYAIYGGTGSILKENIAYNNDSDYAIYGSLAASLIGNTAYFNQVFGLSGDSGNLIKDNTLRNNNISGSQTAGGMSVGNNCRVVGNALNNNYVRNIRVQFSGNALINNHVTASTEGIYFLNSGNYYRNNTASGNTTNYAGSLPTGSGDGGGNASF